MTSTGFFAYPGSQKIVQDAIQGAVDDLTHDGFKITPWENMRIVGFKIDNLIREHIAQADVLIADITYPNANVFYEIGYAIALGKPVLPTVHGGIEKAVSRITQIGLFDTLGWTLYTNANELSEKLKDWKKHSWANKFVRPKDHSQPLFVLDTVVKTDFRNHIFQAVEHSNVNFRSYDPTEVPRLTAAQAISHVSASAGVILPLIQDELVDALRHNQRVGLLLGLCHGFGIEALTIQYEHGPAPVDYRDFITNSTFRHETEKRVDEYCADTLVWNQQAATKINKGEVGLLEQVDLGSPAAENETAKLADYFVRTSEFARAIRAEGAVVAGRKGSGKSAIYLQVMAELERDKKAVVVDLRPSSHNLSEMREALLSVVNAGIFDHTIAAFWQYILYTEILLRIREEALPKARNDFALQERIRQIEAEFSFDEAVVSGDFTARLDAAVHEVISIARNAKDQNDLRARLTNAMFEKPIPRLREAVVSFSDMFHEVTILIDDLDKGWPPRQVEEHDVLTVKHLLEGLNRIQRDLRKKGVQFKHLVFLRSDIYEMLVQATSDRGKYNLIQVDWSDPEQLRHLLRERVVSNIETANHDAAWEAFNPMLDEHNKVDAVSRMIESSLRRPRFLIDLAERTLSFAINRAHAIVDEGDLEEGLRQMSLYLVSDFGYEMRDIAGTPEDIFYLFIGVGSTLSQQGIEKILANSEFTLDVAETIDLLLWYGFLGVQTENDERIFIYDRAYDFRRLEADRRHGPDVRYVVNEAFLRGLN